MRIADILTPDRIACDTQANSKKRVLEQLSALISSDSRILAPAEVFTSLVERERLGSTGLGKGVAIPHGRLDQCDCAIGAFIKLGNGVDFDAADKQPVDLFFGLLVPKAHTDEHLEILALLAELFSDKALCEQLRAATDPPQLFELLTRWHSRTAPA